MTQPLALHVPTPWVLALDIGTSSARALICDAVGDPIPGLVAQVAYAPQTDASGAHTFAPTELLAATVSAIDATLGLAGAAAPQIAAVALDSFWHSLVAVDAQNTPLTPVITWADTRPRQAARELRATLDGAALHQRTGAPLHASFWPAKLRWLRQTQPEAVVHAAQFISVGEWLHRCFLGRSVASLSMASGTGLLATQARTWDADLVAALGIRPAQLPPLGDLGDAQIGLAPSYAAHWPTLAAVPWFPAIGDGAAANVGSDCTTPDHPALTIGTTSAMRVILPLDARPLPPALFRYLLDCDRAVIGGALSEGGNLLAWLEATCRVPSLAQAEADAAQLAPTAHGITILPFIAGERSLGWHDGARLVMDGMTAATTPTELVRAALEALALRLGALHAVLGRAIPEAATASLAASGGTLWQSPVLQQIVADVLGVPLTFSATREASARGAAKLALVALGIAQPSVQEEIHTVAPDPTTTAAYHQAASRQEALYAALFDGLGGIG
jgi:gluconokinase